MSRRFKKALFIFRRDLRLEDNTALLQALENAETVVPCFVFDPRQCGEKNDYRGSASLSFMCGSLDELSEALSRRGSQLYYVQGVAEDVVSTLCSDEHIDAVYFNKDYTPFSTARDAALEQNLQSQGREVCSYHDVLLTAPGSVLKDNGEPYVVYTPFFKRAAQHEVKEPRANRFGNFYSGTLSGTINDIPEDVRTCQEARYLLQGGRKEALKLIRQIVDLSDYKERRDYPAEEYTTKLSAHNKFGTCSAREVYYTMVQAFGAESHLVRELYWRDFFTHIAFHFPHVFNGAFYTQYNAVEWSSDREVFQRWCDGTTGFPIVDAGMRELNATGYMHNRVRMIVASFLTKDLHISWQWGEKYFAQKLIDYDPAVNNGSWQWAASTGCDAQPYFRIFNPWLQQKKFDKDCVYIKQWIPELENLTPQDIHKLDEVRSVFAGDYPEPMVDHTEAKEEAIDMLSKVAKKKS